MNKIYTIEELQTNSFDDKEFIELTDNNHLIICFIIAMFRFVKSKMTDENILNIVKQTDWMEHKFWSWREHDLFILEVAKAYQNIYYYNKLQSINYAQAFVLKYGFRIKDTKQNEEKHFKHLLNYEF